MPITEAAGWKLDAGGVRRVSVIIPAYNAGSFIEESIQSVLDQSWSDLEVIVVDDGSRDKTAHIARAVTDSRVQVISISNGGQAAARNLGLAHATGQAVCFLDADDLWFSDKLEAQVALLTAGTVIVGCPFRYVTANGRLFGMTGEDPSLPANQDRIRRGALLPFPLSAGMIARSALDAVTGFDPDLQPAEDLDLFVRLAQHGEVRWVHRPLGAYRVHLDSESVETVQRQRNTARYVVERTAARAAGRPDPPRPDPSASVTGEYTRTDAAALLFRKAAVLFVNGSRGAALAALLRSARLSPAYILRRGSLRVRGVLAARRFGPSGSATPPRQPADILGFHVSAVDPIEQ